QQSAFQACPGEAILAATAHAAGLLHDLGKYQPEWQSYLRASASNLPAASVPHAVYGAALAHFAFSNPALAWAIAGRHAGLYDNNTIGANLDRQEATLRERLAQLVPEAQADLGLWPSSVAAPGGIDPDVPDSCRRYEFWARVLFSLLVDADRLDTERHTTGRERIVRPLDPTALLDALEGARARRAAGKPADTLNALRNQV